MPYYTPKTDLGWRGIVYPAGLTAIIPDDLAAVLGVGTVALPPTLAESSVPAALKLINGVDVVREIQVIPTVGAGAAKAILAARPEGGYESLAQVWELCPKVLNSPYTTDPEQVAEWGGE